MIAVSLLGRVAVSVDGTPLTGEAAQRRRLALVALLCVPAPRPISRDRLMLYLWPDSDGESARHLLSVAVHVLRKALGHEALVTTADEVSLAPGMAQVDVAAFEEALGRGDCEAAVALYQGPFMDGFHAGAGVELEQWTDGERTRLQRLFAQALESLAGKRRAAGDLAGAAEAWRRLVVLDPFSTHGALGLMRALAEAGNRAGAIRHASIHRQLLDAELGAGPDPAVEALAEALRQEPPASAPAASPTAPMPPEGRPPTRDPAPPVEASPPVAEGLGQSAASGAGPERPPGRRTGGVAWRLRALPRRVRWSLAALALILVAFTGYMLPRLRSRITKAPPGIPRIVAVVPMKPRQAGSEYVVEGIAQEILNALQRVDSLRTISSTSSFPYGDGRRDMRNIRQDLKAEWVLAVSVERAGDRMRVRVEMTGTRDNTVIWRKNYDPRLGDLLATEEAIARSVALRLDRQLRGKARPEESADPRARELYWLGEQAWNRRTPLSLDSAIGFFQQAIARDSEYARAHAGLAQALVVAGSYDYGLLAPEVAYPRAYSAARRAVALDPDMAAGHAALASVYMDWKWDLPLADREFQRALEADSAYLPALQWHALLLVSQGHDEEAWKQLEIAAESDPQSAVLFVQRAHYFYYRHQYDRAILEANQALALEPGLAVGKLLKSLAQIQSGRAAEAAETALALSKVAPVPAVMAVLGYARAKAGDRPGAEECATWLEAVARQRYVPGEMLALVDVGLGDHEGAFRYLEQARRRRSDGIIYLGVEPAMEPLRSDPRFGRLSREVLRGRASAPATVMTARP